MYSKPVDNHRYLHYDSFHAEHIKKSIICSQVLRLRSIYVERKDLKSHVEDLKGRFLRSGSPQQIVQEHVRWAFKHSLEDDIQQNQKVNGIPLVAAYNFT